MGRIIKAFAITIIIILVTSLAFTALRIITWKLFWVIAIIAAIIAYYLIPAMRKSAAK
jgi:hypothetical protein